MEVDLKYKSDTIKFYTPFKEASKSIRILKIENSETQGLIFSKQKSRGKQLGKVGVAQVPINVIFK